MVDPVSLIVAALAAGATASTKEVSKATTLNSLLMREISIPKM
jgi:hypothetical protein